jgi:hypothetical protein
MPTVLLITEQERLRLLFARMERAGTFRLRIAPTLAQGEEEIALRLPHYVFVENRLSGLQASDLESHLRILLPEGPEIVLMARDASETEEVRQLGGRWFLDLSGSDESLQHSITDAIALQPPTPKDTAAPAPLPATPPRGTRDLLFGGSGQDNPAAPKKSYFWFFPTALIIVFLGVMANQAGKKAPQSAGSAAPLKADTAATGKVDPGAARVYSSVPTAPQKAVPPAPAAPPDTAPSGKVVVPESSTSTYVVQQGDRLLKILIRDFGYGYREALAVIPEIRRLNDLHDLDVIQPGQLLSIPARHQAGNLPR